MGVNSISSRITSQKQVRQPNVFFCQLIFSYAKCKGQSLKHKGDCKENKIYISFASNAECKVKNVHQKALIICFTEQYGQRRDTTILVGRKDFVKDSFI